MKSHFIHNRANSYVQSIIIVSSYPFSRSLVGSIFELDSSFQIGFLMKSLVFIVKKTF